jgi:hypothetical protein
LALLRAGALVELQVLCLLEVKPIKKGPLVRAFFDWCARQESNL